MWSGLVDGFDCRDFGAAPLSSSLPEELEVELPVLDLPQSHESDDEELSSSSSLSSQPEELEDEELEEEDELEEEELEEDEELDEEVLDDEEDEELVELLPQLSPSVSLLDGSSVPVDDVVPPHPSSATGASSPVSS